MGITPVTDTFALDPSAVAPCTVVEVDIPVGVAVPVELLAVDISSIFPVSVAVIETVFVAKDTVISGILLLITFAKIAALLLSLAVLPVTLTFTYVDPIVSAVCGITAEAPVVSKYTVYLEFFVLYIK